MGARKIALKKKNKDRHQAYLKLREIGDKALETMTLRNGRELTVNMARHFLFRKPYRMEELQNQLLRKVGQWTLGEKRYNELKEQAALPQKETVSAEASFEVNEG